MVRIIRRFRPDVMTIYDPYGGYGHPDHIQVHRVGLAAFWAAPDLERYPLEEGEEPWVVPKLYWSSWPRSRRKRFAEMRLTAGEITQEEYDAAAVSGTPDELLTMVDTSEWVDTKLKALRAHRSQIPEDWFMLTVPEETRPELVGHQPRRTGLLPPLRQRRPPPRHPRRRHAVQTASRVQPATPAWS